MDSHWNLVELVSGKYEHSFNRKWTGTKRATRVTKHAMVAGTPLRPRGEMPLGLFASRAALQSTSEVDW